MSDVSVGMDVDDEEDGVERGLRFEAIFAKSAELQVTFYAHLPAEVKLVLRHAGECASCGAWRAGVLTRGCRLLPRCVYWRSGHRDGVRYDCVGGTVLRLELLTGALFRLNAVGLMILSTTRPGTDRHSDVLYLPVPTRCYTPRHGHAIARSRSLWLCARARAHTHITGGTCSFLGQPWDGSCRRHALVHVFAVSR